MQIKRYTPGFRSTVIVFSAFTVRGWRPAGLGGVVGLISLALIVLTLGPVLNRVPLRLLQLAIGVLLLLFGMRWLRKANLRGGGIIPLHDEEKPFAAETAGLRDQALRETRLDWFAGVTSFKAVLLEGLEVVFIVIAVGAGRKGLLAPAAAGAIAACLLVVITGFVVHRPLARVPENFLKFAVGVIL